MKTQVKYGMLSLVLVLLGWMTAKAQVSDWEVPGDHFSLEGALELFKKSTSPQEFEQLLNSSDSKVNNLDLNGDGLVDYIKVIDRNEGNIHAFILQAIVSEREYQDVAVIELEKLANGKAVLQITGDEDIYGIETIIEPTEQVRINAGATVQQRVVNVWTWPSVRYVYSPYYSVWVSPWRYSLRPVWWSAWGPVSYYEYYPRWQSYQPYYAVCYTHRVGYARDMYRPYRTTSVIVYTQHNQRIANYRSRYDRDDHYNRGRNNDGRRNDRNEDVASRDDSRNNNRGNNNDDTRKKITGRDDFGSVSRTKTDLQTRQSYSDRNVERPIRNEAIKRPSTVNRYPTLERQEIRKDYSNRTSPDRSTTIKRPTTTPQRSAPREIQRNTVSQPRGMPSQNQPSRVSRQQISKPAAPVMRSSPTQNSNRSGGTIKKKSSEVKKGRN